MRIRAVSRVAVGWAAAEIGDPGAYNPYEHTELAHEDADGVDHGATAGAFTSRRSASSCCRFPLGLPLASDGGSPFRARFGGRPGSFCRGPLDFGLRCAGSEQKNTTNYLP